MILGICGHIGSGKSTALMVLKKTGWFVIDADEIVHDLYEANASGQRKISDFFGEEFLRRNGSVNRLKLRKIVFGNVRKLKILNALIHPLVLTEVTKILNKTDALKIAIEAAYFEDKCLGKLIDKLVLIDRPKASIKVNKSVLVLDHLPKKYDLKISNNSTLKDFEKKVIIGVDKITT